MSTSHSNLHSKIFINKCNKWYKVEFRLGWKKGDERNKKVKNIFAFTTASFFKSNAKMKCKNYSIFYFLMCLPFFFGLSFFFEVSTTLRSASLMGVACLLPWHKLKDDPFKIKWKKKYVKPIFSRDIAQNNAKNSWNDCLNHVKKVNFNFKFGENDFFLQRIHEITKKSFLPIL